MNRHITRNRLLASTVIGGLAAIAASPALAQQTPAQSAPPAEGAAQVEEVIVTGSRIRRDPTTAPTPLVQVSREAILQSGSNSVVDYLADVPALQTSQVPEDTTGGVLGTGGLSTLNLRGLGANRTLVLVDGRRHAGAAYFSSAAVDIDTVPQLLIENIEVITGAASAVYGADAVSGVVNFVLRDDFEGLDVDVQVGQQARDGNGWRHRASVLWGDSWMDGRPRAYLAGEYEHSDRVRNTDIGIMKRHGALLQLDLDPNAAAPDGVIDANWVENLQLITTAYGGSLTLAHSTPASPANDPDIPASNCAAQSAAFAGALAATCFIMDPGQSFAFEGGTIRAFDFGTWRQSASAGRTAVQGSRDARPWADTDNADRLPKQEAWRFQGGATLEITDNIDLFGEYKYVEETNEFGGTPVSFNATLAPFTSTTQARVLGASNAWLTGNDNAFLPAAARAAILANTSGVNGQRALFRQFFLNAGARTQTNYRDTWRYVVGLKGEFDNILGLKDGNWELSYNASEVVDNNVETRLPDMERMAWSFDAVVDTTGAVNGRPGEIVCRVRLQAAQGQQIRRNRDYLDLATNPARFYAATDPAITGCQPINMFGALDLPEDRLGYLFGTGQERGFGFEQQNVLGFVSGDLWDFWGAGAIGVALGFEYRNDGYSGTYTVDGGSTADRDMRVLTGNVYIPTAFREYNSTEGFVELQIPVLRDLPFIQSLDVSAAYRYSDYSLFGGQDVYSLQGSWRINDSLMFRGTHGTSIRVPSLNELYRGAAQTFSLIDDPCLGTTIAGTIDPTLRANRIANCAAQGVPVGWVDPTGRNSVAGFNGNNPNLQPEESTSNTFSIVWTPSNWPNFSLVLDYYDIEITNAIIGVTVANNLFLCYDIAVPNPVACASVTRGPDSDIISFVQGGLNYAKQGASGLDFAMRYRQDLADIFGSDLGMVGITVRGSWTLTREDYTDLVNPNLLSAFGQDTPNFPRLRALTTVSWAKGPLQVNWNIDAIASTEFTDSNALAADPDVRPYYLLEQGSWVQHDINVRYELNDRITLRGGITNVMDRDPEISAFVGDAQLEDYDLYGRRVFMGINAKF